jgi:alanine racemase
VRARAGVGLIAVVKADAYGLGAERVAETLADLVEAFYVFDLGEAIGYRLHALTGRPTIALLGDSIDPREYVAHGVRPAVWTVERATQLRDARPVLAVNTGQQRFAASDEPTIDAVLRAGACDEAFTHASTPAQATHFGSSMRDRRGPGGQPLRLHAAGTALLDDPSARFDAVRPGLALYRGAARVTSWLAEARDTRGPAGYSGFVPATGRHGVILAGYSNGIRPGVCLVNGTRRPILEVGMQSAFVELGPGDKAGDEVVLLGDGLGEDDIADAWDVNPQEALVRLCGAGERQYAD